MDFQSVKENIKKMIYENPERFPFEWIRSYKERMSYQDKLELTDNEKNEYMELLNISKEMCESLLEREPRNPYTVLWNEALLMICDLDVGD